MKEGTTRPHSNPTRPAAFRRAPRRRAASLPGPKVLASLSHILQLESDKLETSESSACLNSEAPSIQDPFTSFRFLGRRSRSYTPESQDSLLTGCGTHLAQLAPTSMPTTIQEDLAESQESHASALIDGLSVPSCSHLHHDALGADLHLHSIIDAERETLVDTTESKTFVDESNQPSTTSKAACNATTDDIDDVGFKSRECAASDDEEVSPFLTNTDWDLYGKTETAPLASSPHRSVHDDVG